MDPLLTWAESKQNEIVAFLRELVECESPSDDPAAVARFTDLVASRVSDIAKVRIVKGTGGYGPHMQLEFRLPGRKKDGQILALGHSDTVYPTGTLASMPCIEKQGKLWGPGVFDMKGGIAMFVLAMRALIEAGAPVRRRVVLQLNSDEEVGSPTSRALTEKTAKESIAVLVVEPSAGPDGNAKTGRKGVGGYTVRVKGRSSHAGLDFAAGASAIVELARQIDRIAGFTDLNRGLTVNPGVIRGGTRTNVVAADAECEVDFRIARLRDYDGLHRKFQKLKPFDKRCTVRVEGGLNRPPLERTKEVVALFKTAQKLARDLGLELGETTVGGGSDGNFTAGMGIPTLDGIGAIGDGAHAAHEHVLLDRIPDRTALLAKLVTAI
jgi:glutamate carboxypeptidase